MRNFHEVVQKIMDVNHEMLNDHLNRSIGYWAPEICWYNLSDYVNRYVDKSSKDPKSLKIYSILCDIPEDEVRQKFINLGC